MILGSFIWLKLKRVSTKYITRKKSLVNLRLDRIVENRLGMNACYKKYFTFEQPHTVEQNTLIIINIEGKHRVNTSVWDM